MDAQEVITGIGQALKRVCAKYSIDKKDVRVKISIKKGNTFIPDSISLSIMSKSNFISDISTSELLELDKIKSGLLNHFLSGKMKYFADKYKIVHKDINGRFYTTSEDYTPRLYLYNGSNPVKELLLEELTH